MKIFDRSPGGKFIFLNSDKLDDCFAIASENNVNNFLLAKYEGYVETDLNPIIKYNQVVKGLDISTDQLKRLELLYEFNLIEYLKVVGFVENGIKINKFNELKYLNIEYTNIKGFKKHLGIRRLVLKNYIPDLDDLAELTQFPNLEYLTLFDSNIENLNGIQNLNKLKSLRIVNSSKLIDIGALNGNTSSLNTIELVKCKKILDYSPLSRLAKLKKIEITECSPIESLNIFKNLLYLSRLSFFNTTVIDNDLSVLLDLSLESVGFKNRKSYSHTLWEVREHIKP